MLLLHQTPSSSIMYEQLMTELADEFWCLAPDTPGFGLSDPLPGKDSIGGYAAAILDWLQALKVQDCFLFGHHTGASIAVQITDSRPQLVRNLVLSGPPLLSDAQIVHLKTTLPSFELDRDGYFLIDLWERLSGKNPDAPLELLFREAISALQCRPRYRAAYEAVFDHPFGEQLADISIPVLLLAGAQDSLIASLEPASRLLQNGTMHIVPHAGTYLCDEAPQQVAQILRTFLA
ncbi:MAG: hydrolase [Ardenticatenaceae bacterium]|nr:MAG: hydrolase [Ardenticatenaceae bacterium]